MAITLSGGGSGNASASSASVTPTGTRAANDIVVVFGYQRATTTAPSVSASGLTFNAVVTASGDATYGAFGVWWARYSSTSNPQITVTGDSGTNLSIGLITMVFTGADTTSTPLTNVGSITNQASASSYSVTGPTGLSADVVMIGCGGSMDNNDPTGSWSSGSLLSSTSNNISAGTDAAQNMTANTVSSGTAGNYTYTLVSVGPDAGRTLIFGMKPAPVTLNGTCTVEGSGSVTALVTSAVTAPAIAGTGSVSATATQIGTVSGTATVAGAGLVTARAVATNENTRLPTIISNGAVNGGTSSVSVPLPSGAQTGDLLMLGVTGDQSDITFTITGWDNQHTASNGTSFTVALFTRVMQSGDTGPWTLTPNQAAHMVGRVIAIREQKTSGAIADTDSEEVTVISSDYVTATLDMNFTGAPGTAIYWWFADSAAVNASILSISADVGSNPTSIASDSNSYAAMAVYQKSIHAKELIQHSDAGATLVAENSAPIIDWVAAIGTVLIGAPSVGRAWRSNRQWRSDQSWRGIGGSSGVSGSATVVGTGSVVAAALLTLLGASTITGSGAVTAAGTLTKYGTATLDGTGSVTAAASVIKYGTATLTGSGTVSAAASLILPGTATITGTGSIGPVNATVEATSSATGVGSVSAAAIQTIRATATVTGAGDVTASGSSQSNTVNGTATVTGSGEVTASASNLGAASITGTGSVSAAASIIKYGTCTVDGTGATSAAASLIKYGASTITGAGTTSAAASLIKYGTSTLSGSGSVAAIVTQIVTAAVDGAGTVSAAGSISGQGTASIVGSGSVSATASLILYGTATITGSGEVSAYAGGEKIAQAEVAEVAASSQQPGGIDAATGATVAEAQFVVFSFHTVDPKSVWPSHASVQAGANSATTSHPAPEPDVASIGVEALDAFDVRAGLAEVDVQGQQADSGVANAQAANVSISATEFSDIEVGKSLVQWGTRWSFEDDVMTGTSFYWYPSSFEMENTSIDRAHYADVEGPTGHSYTIEEGSAAHGSKCLVWKSRSPDMVTSGEIFKNCITTITMDSAYEAPARIGISMYINLDEYPRYPVTTGLDEDMWGDYEFFRDPTFLVAFNNYNWMGRFGITPTGKIIALVSGDQYYFSSADGESVPLNQWIRCEFWVSSAHGGDETVDAAGYAVYSGDSTTPIFSGWSTFPARNYGNAAYQIDIGASGYTVPPHSIDSIQLTDGSDSPHPWTGADAKTAYVFYDDGRDISTGSNTNAAAWCAHVSAVANDAESISNTTIAKARAPEIGQDYLGGYGWIDRIGALRAQVHHIPDTAEASASAYNPTAQGLSPDGTATVSGVGSVSAAGSIAFPGTASITGDGSVTASATQIIRATATISGSGQVTAVSAGRGEATVTGVGTVTAAGSVIIRSTSTITGSGSVSAVASQIIRSTCTLTGSGTVSAVSSQIVRSTCTVVGSGVVTATSTLTLRSTSTIIGSGSVSASGDANKVGEASIAGVGSVTATASVVTSYAAHAIPGLVFINAFPPIITFGWSVQAPTTNVGVGATAPSVFVFKFAPATHANVLILPDDCLTTSSTLLTPPVPDVLTEPIHPKVKIVRKTKKYRVTTFPMYEMSASDRHPFVRYDYDSTVSLVVNGSTVVEMNSPTQKTINDSDFTVIGGHATELTQEQADILTGAGYFVTEVDPDLAEEVYA